MSRLLLFLLLAVGSPSHVVALAQQGTTAPTVMDVNSDDEIATPGIQAVLEFAPGTDTLTLRAREQLTELRAYLNRNPQRGLMLVICSATDDDDELCRRKAEAALEEILGRAKRRGGLHEADRIVIRSGVGDCFHATWCKGTSAVKPRLFKLRDGESGQRHALELDNVFCKWLYQSPN